MNICMHLGNSVHSLNLHKPIKQLNMMLMIPGSGYQVFFFLLFASHPSSRQKDRYHSFECACSNKEDTSELAHG